METVLSVQNLQKNFTLHAHGRKQITGCARISFELKEGEFLGITGPSGAGKSTVLKCIYRTYIPSSGVILYRSARYGLLNLAASSEQVILHLRQEEIGYVSQFLKVMPRVPAVDVLAERLWRRGIPAEEGREIARQYLDRMGITRELWDAYPATFSGGEQQRVNLARALIVRPKLLLVDEPTAALDNKTKKVVLRLLKELKDQGASMVVIYHDPAAMRSLVDRTYVMREGRCDQLEVRGSA